MSELRSHTVTASEFEAAVGHPPSDDDLGRVNCDKVGQIGHTYCGLCAGCGKPRFICGHAHKSNKWETATHCDHGVSLAILCEKCTEALTDEKDLAP